MFSPLTIYSAERGALTRVGIDLARGGCLTEYTTSKDGETHHWLVPASSEYPSCFSMVPFCSRIAQGVFEFGGRTVSLPANDASGVHAIHGHGYQQRWQVFSQEEHKISLGYEYVPGAWPWHYRVDQQLSLAGTKLTLSMQVTNLSDEAMPVGAGIHPFFPKTPRMRIVANTTEQLRLDEQGLPAGIQALARELNMADGLTLKEKLLDHVFMGWDGSVTISWPELNKALTMQSSNECTGLVVWAPPGREFVCIEPVSNLPDSFNHRDPRYGTHAIVASKDVYRLKWSFGPDEK